VAASSSCTVLVSFAPAAAGARSATLSINHNAANSPTTVALSGTGNAAPAAAISINATALNFGSQVVGTAGATQTVTVSNSGSAALAFTGLTLGGTAPGDFSRAGTCSTATPVAAGGSCTLVLGFAPTATGSRSATLTLASNASNGSAAVSLGGTGTATPVPAVGLSASSIGFGNQTVGTSSSATAITLTNSGSAALAISGITSSSSEFGLSHTCPASLAAGGTCTLSTVFTPASTGAKAGTLTLTSNTATSPNTVALSGTGAAVVLAPVLAWTPATTALDFGSATVGAASATQTLTLTNSGSAVANLTAISVSGAAAADFALGQGSCAAGGTLAVGGTCTVVLGFTPTAAGARSASLAVASNGTAPSTVALGGTGTAAPVAAISVAPSAIGFSAVSGVVADAQTLTVQNTGTAVLQVSQLAIGSGGFTVAAASANGCAATPFSLAPGASCALSVAWTSATNASEIGSVVVTSDAPGANSTSVALSGTHTAAPAPGGGTASNTGGGGCSLASGESPTDPVLWLLVVLAGGVLWRRRAP
jgi:MYXO-CTERM domain-containing protein